MGDNCDIQIGDRKGKQLQQGRWSDLPLDILCLILEQLSSIVDKIRFRIVCKNWRRAKFTMDNRPWLLDCSWGIDDVGDFTMSRTFHIPQNGIIYTAKNVIEGETRCGAGICASKNGWLLLQKNLKSWFYNPFSNQVIDLPNMELDFNRATFSSAPTSSDCLCLIVQACKLSRKVLVGTCSPGDDKWHTRILDGFEGVIEDVVYNNRKFFCFFKGGYLAVYDPKGSFNAGWNVYAHDSEINQHLTSFFRTRMVESNGQLLLILQYRDFIVMMFDFSQEKWVRIDTLGNRVLFLSCTSFVLPAEGALSDMADRIYFHNGERTFYFSMKTKETCVCSNYPRPIFNLQDRFVDRVWINFAV